MNRLKSSFIFLVSIASFCGSGFAQDSPNVPPRAVIFFDNFTFSFSRDELQGSFSRERIVRYGESVWVRITPKIGETPLCGGPLVVSLTNEASSTDAGRLARKINKFHDNKKGS